MDTGVVMDNFGKKPCEVNFLTKYSQAKNDEERKAIKDEYEAQEKAYWDWMNKNKTNSKEE